MSAVWHDQPSYYSTSTIADHWDVVEDLGVDSNDGYASGPAITGTSADGYGIADCDQFAGGQTFAIGRRFKYTSLPSVEKRILGVMGLDRSPLIMGTMLTDGRVAIYRGDLEQLLGITTAALTASTQLRLGLRGVIGAGTAGSILLDIDGEAIAIADGIDTGSVPWRAFYVGATTAMFHSHMYAASDGLVRPGYLVEWEPSSNANLDDADHDGSTTVVNLALDASLSTTLASPATKRSIYGVRTVAVVKNLDPAGWKPHLAIEGTLYEADRQPILSTFKAVQEFYALNPATGLPFLGAEWIDADLELGGKAVA